MSAPNTGPRPTAATYQENAHLSGAVRAGAARIGRDPAAFTATVHAAREIVLASLART
ncbi:MULTISPECIES: hypothetical protein [Amycolatopsis]|uniref:Uncharacterized protein n=2 Tax=Amycolatopsis TaxID=1813 RepID=A0A1I4BFM0_9PSEU|nr:hypothetical protein [Amycolatopsis sacchari]SFK67558.1 hypothetical protein SAMN05421835_12853 [Amycolatopsis sacchari]